MGRTQVWSQMTLDTSLPSGAAAASSTRRGDSYFFRVIRSPRKWDHTACSWDPGDGKDGSSNRGHRLAEGIGHVLWKLEGKAGLLHGPAWSVSEQTKPLLQPDCEKHTRRTPIEGQRPNS